MTTLRAGSEHREPDALEQLEQLDAAEPAHTWPALLTLAIVLVEAVVLAAAARSTGSALLLAETAQSLAGAGVEVVLLVGAWRARRPPSAEHPLGHGREAYFWSVLASVGVFVGGGAVSIMSGVAAFGSHARGEAYLLAYLVLAVIVVADGWTLAAAVRPVLGSAIVQRVGFRRGLRQTSDAAARTLIFDNAAAVLGGLVGIAGLAVHQATGDAHADAVASIAIGVLLLATTVALLHTNRELLSDRSIAPEVLAAFRDRLGAQAGITAVPDLLAVYTGPHAVLVAGTVVLAEDLDVPAVEQVLADAGEALAGRWPGELRIYLSPVPAGSP